MTKHERSIKLLDIALDQMGILLINTHDKTELMTRLVDLVQQRNALNSMEHVQVMAYNNGLDCSEAIDNLKRVRGE